MNIFGKKPVTPVEPATPPAITVSEVDWERDKSDVLRIENAAFPANMRSGECDLADQLRKGFGLLARRSQCRNPIGYVVVMPLENASYRGCSEDRSSKKTAYIESLAVMPSESTALLSLVRSLADQLEQRGYQRVTMHVEADNKLRNVIEGFGGREISRFPNWFGWGKAFSYFELDLN